MIQFGAEAYGFDISSVDRFDWHVRSGYSPMAVAESIGDVSVDARGAADFLKGKWVGKGSGYRSEGYKLNGDYKFVITKVRGFSAKATKQYRDVDSGAWSDPEQAYFTLSPLDESGVWQLYGAEGDGLYLGTVAPGGDMILNYLEAGSGVDDAALRIALKKRGQRG